MNKIEWWYYTGHLETESGKRYGYQVTFFRVGVRDRQDDMKVLPLFSELYMAHFALSDIGAKKFTFRSGQGTWDPVTPHAQITQTACAARRERVRSERGGRRFDGFL